jgi:hypothetical protein
MRKFLALSMLMLAGACTPAAEPKPEANETAAPSQVANLQAMSDPERLALWRDDVLRGCIGGGRDTAGPQVPVEEHCACTVEKLVEGRSFADLEAEERTGEHASRFRAALAQCRREIGDGPLVSNSN